MMGQTAQDNSSIILGTRFLQGYSVVFDKANSQIGFTGRAISKWKMAFLILELSMCLLGLMALGLGLYFFFSMRIPKRVKK